MPRAAGSSPAGCLLRCPERSQDHAQEIRKTMATQISTSESTHQATELVSIQVVWGPHDVYWATSIEVCYKGDVTRLDKLEHVETLPTKIVSWFNGNAHRFDQGHECLVTLPAGFLEEVGVA